MTPAGMMFDDALGALGCPLVPTGVGDREVQIEILRALGVAGFVGMASFLLQIGERAKEQGLDPAKDFGLKVAFTTAEPLPDTLRNSVESLFGATVRQGFGTADCGCLAYECHAKGGMHLASRAIVEIADPETGRPLGPGEVGEVVVTLFNKAYPLIRFGTGDLSAVDHGDCACGRRSPKLRGWLGRCDQLVKVKGIGTWNHGAQRWFTFRGMSFQPSELAKLSLLIVLAWYGEHFQRHINLYTAENSHSQRRDLPMLWNSHFATTGIFSFILPT